MILVETVKEKEIWNIINIMLLFTFVWQTKQTAHSLCRPTCQTLKTPWSPSYVSSRSTQVTNATWIRQSSRTSLIVRWNIWSRWVQFSLWITTVKRNNWGWTRDSSPASQLDWSIMVGQAVNVFRHWLRTKVITTKLATGCISALLCWSQTLQFYHQGCCNYQKQLFG